MNTTATTKSFITIPINAVRKGERFTPIEKMGEIVFNVKRKKFERAWVKCPKSYVMTGRLIGVDDEGRDGIFALGDWAIVERASGNVVPNAKTDKFVGDAVASLLAKFARK